MDRRIAAAGIVFLLLSAVVVVQVLDPQFGERSPPEVDFSEPPNEIAADAAEQFEYVDYAYRLDTLYGESGEWRQYWVTQVDHSNKMYRTVGPAGERGRTVIGTNAAIFIRAGVEGDWRVTGITGIEYPEWFLTQPMFVERLSKADARVVTENSSTVTIRVNVNPLKVEGDYPGNATVVVNRSTGIIERVQVTYNPDQMGTRHLRLQVIETGTTVERPEAIGFSPQEFFWDLIRGPLFRALCFC